MVVKHTPACTANDWLAPEQEAAVEGFCLYTGGEGKTINGLIICVASRSYIWNHTKCVECFISSITCPRFVVLQGSSFSSDDRAEQEIYFKRNLCPVGSMCSYQSPIS
jgi:hypothetical protein